MLRKLYCSNMMLGYIQQVIQGVVHILINCLSTQSAAVMTDQS